ncbi:MAG TPA: glycosyltransferase family 4 protein [Aggregicoccus sp.]|nr:glycosyltransferase family 4 protein [Aggregicoccus sp.]
MRIGILMNLAPRKLGSFEGWIVALAREAQRRGHSLDVFGRTPIHPAFAQSLKELGAGWYDVKELEASLLPGIQRLSRYDVLHVNMFVARSRIALMAYAAYPARVVFVDHTSGPVPEQQGREKPLAALLKRAADAVTMVRVDSIAGVSDYVRERNLRRWGLPPERVRTIYNGVDTRRFLSREAFFSTDPALAERELAARGAQRPDAGGPVRLLAVAYLIKEKGVDHLVRALARMQHASRVHLTVAGDGPELPRLKELARSLGIADRVQFAGLRDDVPALLERTDIFVHPAIWAEAFGLTIAEAMSNGCAVVASRIGGIPELIAHEQTGLLFTPGDVADLAQALDRLVQEPALRQQLGRNARARTEQRFELGSCAEQHIGWCEEAYVRKAGRSRVQLQPQP